MEVRALLATMLGNHSAIAIDAAPYPPRHDAGIGTPTADFTVRNGMLCDPAVTQTGDSGAGSLRDAIICANMTPGLDTITFDIPGPGPHTIQPLAPLPTITDPVRIDATTEPHFAGTPVVELDGTLAGAGANGLSITVGGSTVRGLAINRFGGHGIELDTGGGNTIAQNYIGTDLAGTADRGNNGNGIFISSSVGNTIGGVTAGSGNVISGNEGHGMHMVRIAAPGNVVQGNLIGLDVSGTIDLGNTLNGVLLARSTANTIGGVGTGAGNNISGNDQHGIVINGGNSSAAGNNVVAGNLIGTDIAGTADRGNALSGVYITNSPGNTVGGVADGAGNVISGNDRFGVDLAHDKSIGNQVLGNIIGLAVDGDGHLGNTRSGVLISQDASANTVGGTLSAARNVISGNDDHGVQLSHTSTNHVLGNLIGTDGAGTADRGNASSGVYLANAVNNTIRGPATGTENVISGNDGHGVQIVGAGSTGNRVEHNFLGLDISGTLDVGNARSGVLIDGAAGNTVGGSLSTGNFISGNDEHGVFLAGVGATNNQIHKNKIGTDLRGRLDRGNALHGVFIQHAPGNTIGGATDDTINVISGNDRNGIYIFGAGATDNLVQGNWIGTHQNGVAPLANARSGVLISGASGNTIGGVATGIASGAANLISGNNYHGVFLDGAATSGNFIQGNLIGTDSLGTANISNGRNGVFIKSASDNIIGGSASGNRIAFNKLDGVRVEGSATGNAITRNQIFSNVLLGIDLGGDGATANDADDPDSGANNLQNYPGITLAELAGNSLTIDYSVPSTTGNSAYDLSIEFFLTDADDEDGERFLGPDTYPAATAGANREVVLDVTGPGLSPGDHIVATATDANDNTSEFSLFFTIANPPQPLSAAAVDAAFANGTLEQPRPEKS